MKTQIFVFSLTVSLAMVFAGCGSDDSESSAPAQAITITSEDMPLTDGFSFEATYWDLSSFSPLPEGENITWDFRDRLAVSVSSVPPYERYSNPEFPTGNIKFNSTFVDVITGQVRQVHEIRELSADGYYNLGQVYPNSLSLPIFGGAGSISYQAGAASAYNPKRPVFKFPLNYGDRSRSNYEISNSFIADLPSQGINNATANTVDEHDVEIEVVGWGKVLLPTYAEPFDVLMIKERSSSSRQYLLNGMPAPEPLLAALNLSNGPQGSSMSINFLTKEHGQVAGFRYLGDGTLTLAFYRSDIPR